MWQIIKSILEIILLISIAIGILGSLVAIIIFIYEQIKKFVQLCISDYQEHKRNVAEAKIKDQERRQAIIDQMLDNEKKYLAHKERESKKPENILRNNPDLETFSHILETCKSSYTRLVAVNTGLDSQDSSKIMLVLKFLNKHPDASFLDDPKKDKILVSVFKDKALMAMDDLRLPKLSGAECIDEIERKSYLDNSPGEHGDWWHTWKPKLEARALPIIEARERQAANAIRQAQLEQAEAAGQDVCWKCKTIEPRRCKCSDHTCISGNGDCSDYDGECYSCYYLYYD